MSTEHVEHDAKWNGSWWRIAAWGAAALFLLVHLVATQVTDEVQWTVSDFALAAALLFGSLGLYELALRKIGDLAYRTALVLALAGGILLIVVNGAVGIIGSEDNPANLMYGGVLAVGVLGALLARFQPRGMARAMVAAAVAQAAVAAVALLSGSEAARNSAVEIAGLTAFFVLLFLASAVLFQRAGQRTLG